MKYYVTFDGETEIVQAGSYIHACIMAWRRWGKKPQHDVDVKMIQTFRVSQ